jgi:hypothetical protein
VTTTGGNHVHPHHRQINGHPALWLAIDNSGEALNDAARVGFAHDDLPVRSGDGDRGDAGSDGEWRLDLRVKLVLGVLVALVIVCFAFAMLAGAP